MTYEVWNEPDGGFWYPAPDAGAYASLYLATRDAIERVAPGSRVIVGGLAHPDTFIPAMLQARPDLGAHLDGIAIHIYAPRPTAVFSAVRAARRLLDAHALASVPLYITELGWSIRPPHNRNWVPPRLRPQYIERTVRTLARSDCGVGGVLVYSWVTKERDPGYLEDWYGIHPPPPRDADSPDSVAFAQAIRGARDPDGQATAICH
jgi:hypothetical protein